MIFSNLASLQSNVSERLNRNVTTVNPWLREMEFWLENGHKEGSMASPALRIQEFEVERTFDSFQNETNRSIVLPVDYLELRQIRAQWYSDETELYSYSLSQFSELKEFDPCYTVRGTTIFVGEQCGVPVKMHYYTRLTPLNAQNYLGHPVTSLDDSVYLFGILAAAHHQYRNYEASMRELSRFASAVEKLNARAARSREGESPPVITVVGGVV